MESVVITDVFGRVCEYKHGQYHVGSQSFSGFYVTKRDGDFGNEDVYTQAYEATWTTSGRKVRFNLNIHFVEQAQYVLVMGYLSDDKFQKETCFFRLDGTFHHMVKTPEFVYNSIHKSNVTVAPEEITDFSQYKQYKVESPATISFKAESHKFIGSYFYAWEWVQYRYYDPETQTWGSVEGTSRA